MLNFIYTAKNKEGNPVGGLVEAESESAAAKLLIAQGLAPLDIKVKEENKGFFSRFSSRIPTKDKIIFSRQLATLINAGLPLTQSLRTVSEQTSSKQLALIIQQVIASVEGGVSLAESIAKHPKVFNDVYVALVAAGETSGTLDQALERIATQQEKDAEMTSKIRGALIYPIIVLVVIMGVVTFLLTTVVPQIQLLYNDFNKDLPFLTAIMIAVANFIIHFWWLILIGLIVGGYFLAKWFKTRSGQIVADNIKIKIPLFGDLFQKLYMARFCRTGETLMQTGVPMLEMLKITARAVDNMHVQSAIGRAAEKVKGGKALSQALIKEPTFLALVPQMLKIGEQSGAIDKMMGKAATYYEDELDTKIKTISTIIEPVLMVFLAVVVGGIVLAILVPVYGLVGANLSV
jgi:type IV pilus assembly protein PilC